MDRRTVRECRFNTEQMVFPVPRSALSQLPAMCLAGVVVAVVAGSGAWLYLASMGETVSLLAWFVGALFVPALPLALGAWTGDSRAFELDYLLRWYTCLAEGVPALDYAGATAAGLAMGMPFVYLGLTAEQAAELESDTAREAALDRIRSIEQRVYGGADAVDPCSVYRSKANAGYYQMLCSAIKDCVPVDAHFPLIYDQSVPDGYWRLPAVKGLGGIEGPSLFCAD